MKKRRIIVAASIVGGLSLAFAILYPLLTEDFKWKASSLFLLGAIMNAVAMGMIVRHQLKRN